MLCKNIVKIERSIINNTRGFKHKAINTSDLKKEYFLIK